jgi:hypothetical protein
LRRGHPARYQAAAGMDLSAADQATLAGLLRAARQRTCAAHCLGR